MLINKLFNTHRRQAHRYTNSRKYKSYSIVESCTYLKVVTW